MELKSAGRAGVGRIGRAGLRKGVQPDNRRVDDVEAVVRIGKCSADAGEFIGGLGKASRRIFSRQLRFRRSAGATADARRGDIERGGRRMRGPRCGRKRRERGRRRYRSIIFSSVAPLVPSRNASLIADIPRIGQLKQTAHGCATRKFSRQYCVASHRRGRCLPISSVVR